MLLRFRLRTPRIRLPEIVRFDEVRIPSHWVEFRSGRPCEFGEDPDPARVELPSRGTLLEPFYRGTADTPSPGTGLGLNMARRYVEAMGGNLRVESDGLDLGSTFVVTLPYQPGRSVEDTLQN